MQQQRQPWKLLGTNKRKKGGYEYLADQLLDEEMEAEVIEADKGRTAGWEHQYPLELRARRTSRDMTSVEMADLRLAFDDDDGGSAGTSLYDEKAKMLH